MSVSDAIRKYRSLLEGELIPVRPLTLRMHFDDYALVRTLIHMPEPSNYTPQAHFAEHGMMTFWNQGTYDAVKDTLKKLNVRFSEEPHGMTTYFDKELQPGTEQTLSPYPSNKNKFKHVLESRNSNRRSYINLKEWDERGTFPDKAGADVRYGTEFWDYHHGQSDASMFALTKEDGQWKTIGKLDFSLYHGDVKIKMIEVDPKYRRRGIGLKMVDLLGQEYGKENIEFGGTTPEGEELRQAYHKESGET